MRCHPCSITAPVDTTGSEPTPSSPPPPAPRRRGGSRLQWVGLAVSLLSVAGVVWWAPHQEPPQLPPTGPEWAALLGAVALYALATVVRGERWQRLLEDEGGHARARATRTRSTCVGYMGNNVLPARAGDAVRVVLMAPRAGDTSMRTVIGTLLAERLLDVAVLVVLFVVVGYGLLGEVGGGKVEIVAARWPPGSRSPPALALPAGAPQRAPARPSSPRCCRRRSGLRRAHHGLLLLGMTLLIWAIEAGVWMAAGARDRLRHGPDRRALHRRAGERVLDDPLRPRLRRHAGRRRDPRHQGARRHRRPGGRLHRDAALRHRRPDHARRPRAARRPLRRPRPLRTRADASAVDAPGRCRDGRAPACASARAAS